MLLGSKLIMILRGMRSPEMLTDVRLLAECRFTEYQDLAQLRFNFADKSSPFQMVQALSSHLQEVPAEDVLLSLHHVPQV